MSWIYLTLSFILLFAILAVFLRDILLSVLSLAVVSALLSVVFYQLKAPVAGAFELSVGAGLITVLIVLTIAFFQTKKEGSKPKALFWTALSFACAALLFVLFQAFAPLAFPTQIPPTSWQDVGEVLWKVRVFDLAPQILVVISAILGILALLRKEEKK